VGEGGRADEVPLAGGRVNPGVVRVGETVRRPMGGRAPFIHDLLVHLERVGFDSAPRFLGVDDVGREIFASGTFRNAGVGDGYAEPRRPNDCARPFPRREGSGRRFSDTLMPDRPPRSANGSSSKRGMTCKCA
jgi:hypothetical protein